MAGIYGDSTGTLGVAMNIEYIGDSINCKYYSLTYALGSGGEVVLINKTSTAVGKYSWTPPLSLATNYPNKTNTPVALYLHCFDKDMNVQNTFMTSITLYIPESIKPSCTIDISDEKGYLSTYGGYVQGMSVAKISINTIEAYGSPVRQYSTNTDDYMIYSVEKIFTTYLPSSGTHDITTTVYDSRGRSGTASKSITVLPYTSPRIGKVTVGRCNADGTNNDKGEYIRVTFSYTATNVSNKNAMEVSVSYKKSLETVYDTIVVSELSNNFNVTDHVLVFKGDTNSAYDILLTVKDNFTKATRETSASSGGTILHFLANGLGLAIGKIASLSNLLDIGYKTRLDGGLLYPILPAGTNLNDVTTPNFYMGQEASSQGYSNLPFTKDRFTLEVTGDEESSIHQRITRHMADMKYPIIYERIQYNGSWGEWYENDYVFNNSHLNSISEEVGMNKSQITDLNSSVSTLNDQRGRFDTYVAISTSNTDILPNLLYVNFNDRYGTYNRKYSIWQPEEGPYWNTFPTAIQNMNATVNRTVEYISYNDILVKLEECYPVCGRKWYNRYYGGSWSGWREETSNAFVTESVSVKSSDGWCVVSKSGYALISANIDGINDSSAHLIYTSRRSNGSYTLFFDGWMLSSECYVYLVWMKL